MIQTKKGIPAVKRMMLILMAFVTLCSCALAETTEKTVYDFDDFTIEWYKETPCKTGYKVEGQS